MSWPIVLPHEHARKIIERQASLLILTRRLKPGSYEIQDAGVVKKNAAHQKKGETWLMQEPGLFLVDVQHVERRLLLDLDLVTVRRTGYKTLEEFFMEWLSRRKRIDTGLEVNLHFFTIGEDVRFLHRQSHKGYTSNPTDGVRGEQQSLSGEEQAKVSQAAFERDDASRRERVKVEHASTVEAVGRLREALKGHRGMGKKVRAIEHQLSSLERDL